MGQEPARLGRVEPPRATAGLRILRDRHVAFGLRLLLGGLWIFSGAGKMPDRAGFVDVVVARHLLPDRLAEVYGSAVPWAELVLGVALVLGLFLTWTSTISLLLVVSFLVANAAALGAVTEIYTPCGCVPGIPLTTTGAVILDFAMIAGFAVILLRKRDFLSLKWPIKR